MKTTNFPRLIITLSSFLYIITCLMLFSSTVLASDEDIQLHFDEINIEPNHVTAGEKFYLTIRYTASNPNAPNQPISIKFYFEFVKDHKVVFKSKTETIESLNNQSVFATKRRVLKASKKKGEYMIKVYLLSGESKGKMGAINFAIE